MTTARLVTAVRTMTGRAAARVGVLGLVGLLLSGCAGTGRVHGSGHSTATTVAPSAAPATVVKPLYLGHGVGIVTETGSSGGCSELLATTDFTHWRTISPPQQSDSDGSCSDVWQSASFVSPLQGWVLGWDGGGEDTVLYRTDNGGTTWLQVTGSSQGSDGGTQVIGFTSAEDGWRQQFATGSNAFYLLETTGDGGETWSGIPQFSTNGGCEFAVDVFANPLDGFAGNNLAPGTTPSVGAPPPQGFLWETVDGGRSWHEATAPTPPGTIHATAFYGLPTFFSPTSGILPVEYVHNGQDRAQGGAASTTGRDTLGFYATSNSGRTWALVSTVKVTGTVPTDSGPAGCFSSPSASPSPSPSPSRTSGPFPAVTIAGPTTWWVVSSDADGTTVDVTSDGGGLWTDLSVAGLGADDGAKGDLTLVGATGSKVAWASVADEADESAPPTFETTDGGRTWSPLDHLTVVPTPAAPAASTTSPACTNDQLTTRAGRSGAGLGHVAQVVVFANVSASSCTLYGYPGVAGLTAAGTQVVQATRTLSGYMGGLWSTPNGPVPTVALAPGQAASALIEGVDNQVGSTPCVRLSGFMVTAPNTTRSVELPSETPACDGLEVHPVVPGTNGTQGS